MRDVAERRQQLEQEHERALQALQKKQEEVRQLQQAQAEARKEHEGAVQLLENSLDCMQARVRELEEQCHSHTEQFNFLSQELKQFRLQTEKISLPPSSQVTSEVTFTTCQTSLQLLEGLKEKDPETATISPRCSQKAQDGGLEGTSRLAEPVVPAVVRSPGANTPPLASKKMVRKLESQSSSSRSESMQNSPKSCPTPEVDTASEMEELDIDTISLIPEPENQGPVKLRVFLARYSYNPFAGPNENPEAELPLTAGEYIYVYGEMDEDGFFEGELMDGRRGLVPSNFVERVSDEDLVTFLPQELHDLSQSSPLERSSLSTSLSSAERSDCSTEELSASTAPSRLEEDEGARPTERASLVVPYPRKVTLIKQFGSSLLVGWEPPLPTPGSSEIQSYNLYVDSELRQTVKAGSQTKAVVERLDLKTRTYRLSVQSVSEAGSSDRLRCTFLAGGGFAVAPTQLRVRSVAATSAQISWVPSNSNFPHTVYLNGEEHEAAKAGVYWYTFRNLNPSTSYVATVEVQPQQQALGEPAPEKRDQPLSAEIQFTTASAGSPDAPLDVRVEAGPSPGILVISWLPVTIDAEGSSNGVRVTGYAVYADGQKVMEVTSPTAGSVLAEISQLQILQVCQEVSVRTVSLYGESVDSVPAQIPLALLGDATSCSSPLDFGGPAMQLPGREGRDVLTSQTSQACGTKDTPAAAATDSFAKSTFQPSVSRKKSGSALLAETSPKGSTSPTRAALTHVPQGSPPETGPLPRGEGNAFAPVTEGNPAMLRKESEEGDQQPLLVSRAQEAASRGEACSADLGAKEPPPKRGAGSDPSCLGAKLLPPSRSSLQGEERSADSGQSERRAPESVAGSSGRLKLLKEIPRDDSLLAPRVRREGEKRSDAGNRPVTLLTDHSRGSDLSDIMEEEEEEEEEASQPSGKAGESKWAPSECPGRENGEKVSGNGNLELLNSTSWQVPTRRGRRPRRRSQDVAEPPDTNSDSWRSPSPEPMDSGGSARLFVALFDYDPPSMSPNPDAAEEELPFQEGQILKVYGHKDADGFYRGKCGGRTGYVPCNMVSEVQVDSEATRKQLLEEGRIPTDMLVESLDNGVFSPPPRRLTVRPPKPRRSKKVEQEKQEEKNPCFDAHKGQDLSSEDDAPRTMVAIFDYNPKENSPNLDTEAELRFCAGDIVTVLSSMDDDGFYYGEVNGQKGLAPSNFLEAMSLDGELPAEPNLGRQRMRKRRVQ
ncbi:peripheral-type benzodiazepine receptor-associated protein 1 isoform X4 [Podarcis muralis]